jgi:hypothetical protein
MVAPSPEREESAARVAAGRRGSPIASPMPIRAGSTRSADGVRPEAGGSPRPPRARTGAADGALAAAEAGRAGTANRVARLGETARRHSALGPDHPADGRPLTGKRGVGSTGRGWPPGKPDRVADADPGRIDLLGGRGATPRPGAAPRGPPRACTGAAAGAITAAVAGPRGDGEPRRPARGERPPAHTPRARSSCRWSPPHRKERSRQHGSRLAAGEARSRRRCRSEPDRPARRAGCGPRPGAAPGRLGRAPVPPTVRSPPRRPARAWTANRVARLGENARRSVPVGPGLTPPTIAPSVDGGRRSRLVAGRGGCSIGPPLRVGSIRSAVAE